MVNKITKITFGLIVCIATRIEAKDKPFTIINASGKNLYLSWLHKGVKTEPFFVYVKTGGDIRIKSWSIDKETVILVAKVKDIALLDTGSLDFYRFEIASGKTVNVKIKNDGLLYPNALFGDLKEKDIKVRCEKDGSKFNVSINERASKKCQPTTIPFSYTADTKKFIPQEEDYQAKLTAFLNEQK
jgi:hypothetical protein